MAKENENVNINVNDVNELLQLFGKLDRERKKLALATITGMVLMVDADKKGA